jgi:acyl-coenzyme A synthetase/AMP-(fatty) acid ligase
MSMIIYPKFVFNNSSNIFITLSYIVLEIPEIEDVMVYGEANIITGQTVVCDVVLKYELTQNEIKKIVRKFCKDKLDAYKIPTKVNVVDKTNFGDRFKKIRRR